MAALLVAVLLGGGSTQRARSSPGKWGNQRHPHELAASPNPWSPKALVPQSLGPPKPWFPSAPWEANQTKCGALPGCAGCISEQVISISREMPSLALPRARL